MREYLSVSDRVHKRTQNRFLELEVPALTAELRPDGGNA